MDTLKNEEKKITGERQRLEWKEEKNEIKQGVVVFENVRVRVYIEETSTWYWHFSTYLVDKWFEKKEGKSI